MYTIGEVSEMFNLPVSTLRYYDKEGLLPDLQRVSGMRRFSDKTVETLQVIECLKKSGMEIKDIKEFIKWCSQGSETYPKRYEMFLRQREEAEREIKKLEKKHRKSAMDGISKAQSALMSAQKISKNAVKKGFEWPNEDSLWECFESETREFKEAIAKGDKENAEEELGDILFAAVNLARWNKIDAEQALLKANRKFMARFRKMEEIASKNPAKPMENYTFEEYDALWKQAKKEVKKSAQNSSSR